MKKIAKPKRNHQAISMTTMALASTTGIKLTSPSLFCNNTVPSFLNKKTTNNSKRCISVSAFGEVSSDGTVYLVAGAIGAALLGSAFPILFSREDLCPERDGAGFVRKSARTLRANSARKDDSQIVCPRCSGLGKLQQINKR